MGGDITETSPGLQLQKHDGEDEDVPSKWRSEAEMAAEAAELRERLKDL